MFLKSRSGSFVSQLLVSSQQAKYRIKNGKKTILQIFYKSVQRIIITLSIVYINGITIDLTAALGNANDSGLFLKN